MGEPSSADDTTSASTPLLACDEVQGLIEEGHEQGFLSSAHVAAALQDVDLTAEQLDELLLALTDLGIEIVESEGRRRRAATARPTRLPPSSTSR